MNAENQKIELEVKVEGMSCQHCVNAVDKAVRSIPGVTDAEVDLKGGTVVVRGLAGAFTRQQVVDAINRAGYTAS